MQTPPRNEQLERAITADPDSADAYLVYGDWLLERGEDLGELVSVQAMRAIDPADTALADRERDLIAEHGRRWLGYFARSKHTWRFGFLESLVIGEASREDLVELHALVAARFLRDLDLDLLGHRAFENQALIGALAELGLPPVVRKLTLAPHASVPRAVDVGSLHALGPRLARVEDLTIRAGHATFAGLVLPAATSVAITTNAAQENLASLARVQWPKLTTFSLTLTARSYEQVDAALFEPLLSALGELRLLRHLTIAGGLNDESARRLVEASSTFRHLEGLDLGGNFLSEAIAAELTKVYGTKLNVDGQMTRGANDDDDVALEDLEEAPALEPTRASPLRHFLDEEDP